MPITAHNPNTLYPQYQNYSHAIEVTGDARLLVVSGLNGYLPDGKAMPEGFEEQGDMIWRHLGEILRSADMSYGNIISLRTYLADPKYDDANVALRKKYLSANQPALTVICAKLLLPNWKIEMEAMAAA